MLNSRLGAVQAGQVSRVTTISKAGAGELGDYTIRHFPEWYTRRSFLSYRAGARIPSGIEGLARSQSYASALDSQEVLGRVGWSLHEDPAPVRLERPVGRWIEKDKAALPSIGGRVIAWVRLK